jgi:SMODS-associated NUDIX domain
MMRVALYVIAVIIGAILLPFVGSSTAPFILIVGIMAGIGVPLLDSIASNFRYLRLAYYSVRYMRRTIRMSVSYLFRIKVDDRYLLVKGLRWQHYQPVGGVYKMSAGAKSVMDELGALSDDLVPIDAISMDDLRIRIPALKLIPFVRWFESGRSRETSPWREFYEELLKTELLPGQAFPFIFDDFIRRDIQPIRFSPYARALEIMITDIHELLPTSDQLRAMRRLKGEDHPDVMWATEEQIRRLGAQAGENQEIQISETAVWTL